MRQFKSNSSRSQWHHNDLLNQTIKTKDLSVSTVENVVIYRQTVGRIKFQEKGVIAPTGEIKLQNSTQLPRYIICLLYTSRCV